MAQQAQQDKLQATDDQIKSLFNQWVGTGRARELENHHAYIAAQAVGLMDLKSGDRVLDLGCGTGWATRLVADRVRGNGGIASGLDISDEMVRVARSTTAKMVNISFHVGSAENMPFAAAAFNIILSIESFYYYPDLSRVLREMLRVTVPGGRIFILMDLYSDRLFYRNWAQDLGVPVHVLSESEYVTLLAANGFIDVKATHIPEKGPSLVQRLRTLLSHPVLEWPSMFMERLRHGKDVRVYREKGALLLIGTRP